MQQVRNIADAERFFGNADIRWVWYLLLKHCIIATAGQWRNAPSGIQTYIVWRCNSINCTLSCLFWNWDKRREMKENIEMTSCLLEEKNHTWYLRMIYLENVKIME